MKRPRNKESNDGDGDNAREDCDEATTHAATPAGTSQIATNTNHGIINPAAEVDEEKAKTARNCASSCKKSRVCWLRAGRRRDARTLPTAGFSATRALGHNVKVYSGA